jgi:hypothetical protein
MRNDIQGLVMTRTTISFVRAMQGSPALILAAFALRILWILQSWSIHSDALPAPGRLSKSDLLFQRTNSRSGLYNFVVSDLGWRSGLAPLATSFALHRVTEIVQFRRRADCN